LGHRITAFGIRSVELFAGEQSASGLFTAGADKIDFNFDKLTLDQQASIAAGADIYYGLGGSNTVTLPNESNYNESVGSDGVRDAGRRRESAAVAHPKGLRFDLNGCSVLLFEGEHPPANPGNILFATDLKAKRILKPRAHSGNRVDERIMP
jgi:hypothetical protein